MPQTTLRDRLKNQKTSKPVMDRPQVFSEMQEKVLANRVIGFTENFDRTLAFGVQCCWTNGYNALF